MRYVMRRGAICAVTECWFGDHGTLERHHHYIQWLFPVYENSGVNRHASALRRAEAREMRRDLGVARRIVRSYQPATLQPPSSHLA
jgi:hypothetical protein